MNETTAFWASKFLGHGFGEAGSSGYCCFGRERKGYVACFDARTRGAGHEDDGICM